MTFLNIPKGRSDFETIRRDGLYYVDKTGLIGEILKSSGTQVTLITRPRRFGKTLGMSTLECFLDIQKDSKVLFEGLEISKQRDICEEWMNQWPVMSLSLKAVEGNDFSTAYMQLVYEVGELFKKHEYLMESSALNAEEKKKFGDIRYGRAGKIEVMRSLQILSEFLNKYYNKSVILLIDEYDVPMARATSNGYYKEMLEIMKGFMQALKDNQCIKLAVITGCLKIAKESIFTGTNIDYAGASITKKLETLMNGGYIIQRVDENLTYDYLHSSEENLWSLMYLTGYLTQVRDYKIDDGWQDNMVALKIPNLEIKQIFETEVSKWFEDSSKKWNRAELSSSVWSEDCDRITKEVSALLRRTISYHDYGEDFYHAFLSGIFAGAGYQVDSNKEHGEVRSDVVVCDTINGYVAIFEAKRARSVDELDSECEKALRQIDERMYARDFEDEYDSDHIHCYGIAFYKKRCLVKKK